MFRELLDEASEAAARRLTRGLSTIRQLADATPTWAGQAVEPPAAAAIETAADVYRHLVSADVVPDRIIASGEGGVAFYFLSRHGYADIEILNSGELLASTEDRNRQARDIWEFVLDDLAETVNCIQQFLLTHGQSPVR